jgi:hypothetical protein
VSPPLTKSSSSRNTHQAFIGDFAIDQATDRNFECSMQVRVANEFSCRQNVLIGTEMRELPIIVGIFLPGWKSEPTIKS